MGIFGEFSKPDVEAMEKKRDVEGLIKTLEHKDRRVKWLAVEALGKIRGEKAVEPLIIKLRDPEPAVQLDAANALGKIGDERAVEQLIS